MLVAPGIYREYVDPVNAGTQENRITYRSTQPLGAVITGAEQVKGWKKYEGTTYGYAVFRTAPSVRTIHIRRMCTATGILQRQTSIRAVCISTTAHCMTTATLEECLKGDIYECSCGARRRSRYKWYTEQDEKTDQTVLYANFRGADPNAENVEINVRRECFFPSKTGVGYLTVSGFKVEKAATTWAPPAAFQDGMIGPHWSKGWIIEDCEIAEQQVCRYFTGQIS